jgi:L-asparaginase II
LTLVAEVIRNGFVESIHHGRVIAVGTDGTRRLAVGDVTSPFFPRSAMKPLQTLGMLRAGWAPVDDEQVALACASHSGEPAHVAVVRRMLAAASLGDDALDNTPSWPLAEEAARDLVRAGAHPDRLHQNCSGKHAAMLATCVANGWPTQAYLDPSHPLQLAIRESIEDIADEKIDAVAVDGCGAPLFALSPIAVARAFGRLVTADAGTPERRVADAMRAHPFLVGGTDRDITRLLQSVDGLLVKDGAEGVCAAATADGVGVVVKIDDGSGRARTPVLVHALRQIGAAAVDTKAVTDAAVLGHGVPVGAVRAVF